MDKKNLSLLCKIHAIENKIDEIVYDNYDLMYHELSMLYISTIQWIKKNLESDSIENILSHLELRRIELSELPMYRYSQIKKTKINRMIEILDYFTYLIKKQFYL